MTSNSPDSLDPALVRPGRIDRKVLFGYASSEVIRKLFVHIFSKAPEEQLEGEKAEECQHDIRALADKFAATVPPNKLTPAEVQGYLLVHREDPVEAVTEAEEWVQKTIATKEKGTNVEAFAGQENSQAKEEKREGRSKKKSKKAKSARTASPYDEGEVDDSESADEETSSSQTGASSSPEESNSSETTRQTSSRSSVANVDPPVYTPPMPTAYSAQNPTTYSTSTPASMVSQTASPYYAPNPSLTHSQSPVSQSSAPTFVNSADASALQALSLQQLLQAGSIGIVVPSFTPPVPVGTTVGQAANEVVSSAVGVKKKTKARSKRK